MAKRKTCKTAILSGDYDNIIQQRCEVIKEERFRRARSGR